MCEREALSTIALHGLRFCADTLPCRLEAHVDVLLETLKTIASEDTALTTRCALAVPTIDLLRAVITSLGKQLTEPKHRMHEINELGKYSKQRCEQM